MRWCGRCRVRRLAGRVPVAQAGHEVVVLEAGTAGGRAWSQELVPVTRAPWSSAAPEFVLDDTT